MTRDDDFLSRWSRRKHAAKRGEPEHAPKPVPVPAAAPAGSAVPAEAKAEEPLPDVESLTPESDFAPFMRKEVDPGLRRQALKTLFRDPRFNVMDGLDVYIDDFSKPDPIPPEWLGMLNQMAHLGDYAQTKADAEARDKAREAPKDPQITAANQPNAQPDPPGGSDTSAPGSPERDSQQS